MQLWVKNVYLLVNFNENNFVTIYGKTLLTQNNGGRDVCIRAEWISISTFAGKCNLAHSHIFRRSIILNRVVVKHISFKKEFEVKAKRKKV